MVRRVRIMLLGSEVEGGVPERRAPGVRVRAVQRGGARGGRPVPEGGGPPRGGRPVLSGRPAGYLAASPCAWARAGAAADFARAAAFRSGMPDRS
ncbi:hypothetical protein GCM10010466_00010 [Planomonospora alba]|uniref:Uncharacterized protein n=1 Tax=Planomonospora alba TaxID=161354 RepID=A0ABP6MGS1_9ACTN